MQNSRSEKWSYVLYFIFFYRADGFFFYYTVKIIKVNVQVAMYLQQFIVLFKYLCGSYLTQKTYFGQNVDFGHNMH